MICRVTYIAVLSVDTLFLPSVDDDDDFGPSSDGYAAGQYTATPGSPSSARTPRKNSITTEVDEVQIAATAVPERIPEEEAVLAEPQIVEEVWDPPPTMKSKKDKKKKKAALEVEPEPEPEGAYPVRTSFASWG